MIDAAQPTTLTDDATLLDIAARLWVARQSGEVDSRRGWVDFLEAADRAYWRAAVAS